MTTTLAIFGWTALALVLSGAGLIAWGLVKGQPNDGLGAMIFGLYTGIAGLLAGVIWLLLFIGHKL